MSTRTKAARLRSDRIKRLANEDWNAIASEVDPKIHARRHLAEMSPERRAELNREWNQ